MECEVLMFGKSVIFGLVFLGFDFFIYFLVFLLSALILKSFPISESILFGAESVLWRVIYLQALFQLLLVSIVRYFELQNNFLLVLFIMIFAFAASSLIVFKESLQKSWYRDKICRTRILSLINDEAAPFF